MIRRGSALLVALLACGAVRGDDTCLTGTSTLGDQRAIVALRAEADATCPCATAATRGSYKRCTKGVLASVLTAGGLRTACEPVAKRLFKAATCGIRKTTCGRVKPTSEPPVSCRVKRARSCTDRASYDQTACENQAFCADVVEWTAGTCSDVRVRGPFQTGMRTITMTKKSVVHPEQDRVLDTVVWYPTAADAGPVDGTGGVVDAPLDLSGAPYPVLLFSHGSCGYPLQSTFLLPLIASRGYVVIAPPHPGNTIFELPACGSSTAVLEAAVERPQDVIFALDQMLAAGADPGSPFFGALDLARIGMSGHSFGGFTTFRVLDLDARFRVAIPMAPATPAGSASFAVPSLMMLGSIDSVVNNASARQAYADSASPKYKVEIEHAGHYAFSNGCFPSSDCNPPTTLTQDEAHAAVLRWVIPFLEWQLRGDARFSAFFEPPTPPGVLFDAAP